MTDRLSDLAAELRRCSAIVAARDEVLLVADAHGVVGSEQPRLPVAHSDELTGPQQWFSAFHPDDRPNAVESWQSGIAGSTDFTFVARLWDATSREYRFHQMLGVAVHADTVEVARGADTGSDTSPIIEWVVTFTDIHDQATIGAREQLSAERFQRIFDANVFGICFGIKHRIYEANAAFLEIIARPRSALAEGIKLADLIDDAPELLNQFEFGDASEYELVRGDGKISFVYAAGVSLAPERGWLAVAVDLTHRRIAERAMQHLALHDPLTGLANRRLLTDRLAHAIANAERRHRSVGVLFCDLDHFKTINDVYGHSVGDQVLRHAASRITDVLRDGETVARIGGDEFVVVLEDLETADHLTVVAERIRDAVSDPMADDDRSIHVEMSIGGAISDGADETTDELLARADDAMYNAKRAGRDRVVVAASASHEPMGRRSIERAVNRALISEQLGLVFQPIIDLETSSFVATEALLRLASDGAPLPTAQTIAIAEEIGMIARITDWVVKRACQQFGDARHDNIVAKNCILHINISGREISTQDFVERILRGIATSRCQPNDVCLEITETAKTQINDRTRASLNALRDAGIAIAIDDFGVGFASLETLQQMPFDILKIDRSFVRGIADNPLNMAIVRNTIAMAHDLGIKVIGEGVERHADATALVAAGCDWAQGFAIARPGDLAALNEGLPRFTWRAD